MSDNIIVPYSATAISIGARFIFMYLLYTKKSTNIYSLIFCIMNIISSILWIDYSINIEETPIMVRGIADLVLFTLSSIYIINNKRKELKLVKPASNEKMHTTNNIQNDSVLLNI
jgi:lipid-A-disaccharide synthase-like uncharacterized protein